MRISLIKVFSVLTLSTLSACTTYKIQSLPDPTFYNAVANSASTDELERRLTVEKLPFNAATHTNFEMQTEAVFCSEPLITVMTLGILPMTCLDTYRATLSSSGDDNPLTQDFKTRYVVGWAALFLLPSADWKYGNQERLRDAIHNEILEITN